MNGFWADRAKHRENRRRVKAKRLAARVKIPVSANNRGLDPMIHKKKPLAKSVLSGALCLLVAVSLHAGPVLFFLTVDRGEDGADKNLDKPSKIVVRMVNSEPAVIVSKATEKPELDPVSVETEPEPVTDESLTEKSRKVSKSKSAVKFKSEPLPTDWVDMAKKDAEVEQTPRRRVVGISFESTVSGNGPRYAVGNTRMGRTDSEADDPDSVDKLGRATQKAVSERQDSGSNRTASFIPGKRIKFQKPKRLKEVALDYPSTLKAQGIEGNVVVMIRIGPNGRVEGVRILKSSGHAELDKAARRAAKRESFSPAKRNGEPVDYDLKYTYRFRIKTT